MSNTNVFLYKFNCENKNELEEEVCSFTPSNIIGASPEKFWRNNLIKVDSFKWAFDFGKGPFKDYDFKEDEDEEECLLNPYYIQFARFAAYLAKLAIRFDCDVEFVLHFEYAMKSETGVAGMDVAFDSREDRRLFFRLNMEDGSQKEVAYLPFEITG